ncbi:hypothetical protein K3495_g16627, partial [Podosphaera aphanis]
TENEIDQFLLEWDLEEEFTNSDEPAKHSQWITEFGPIDPRKTVVHLNNQSTLHAISKKDIFKNSLIGLSNFPSDTWKQEASIDSRYSETEFHGIMPDTGAAGVSTAGEPQFIALQRLNPDVKIEKSSAGEHKIRFGKGEVTSLGSTEVNTPLGPITFHVVPLNTPFLLCIQDMKRMGVILDNLQNVLIQGQKIVPVVMKFGHPWMHLFQNEQSVAFCHLTESELRQLHRRFGHPSIKRLVGVLQRAGHNVENKLVEKLT